jgi:hypothetical protein
MLVCCRGPYFLLTHMYDDKFDYFHKILKN